MAEPLDFDGPASIVLDAYNRSVALVESAKSEMTGFTDALNSTIYAPPTISVQWTSLAAPSIPDVPDMPSTPGATGARGPRKPINAAGGGRLPAGPGRGGRRG